MTEAKLIARTKATTGNPHDEVDEGGNQVDGGGIVIGLGLVIARYFGDFDSMVLVCPNYDQEYQGD